MDEKSAHWLSYFFYFLQRYNNNFNKQKKEEKAYSKNTKKDYNRKYTWIFLYQRR